MIELDIEFIKDNCLILNNSKTKTGAKKVKRLYKKAVKSALEDWHKRNIKKHFKKKAIEDYAPYKKYYRGNRKPLHISGVLERNISRGIKVTAKQGDNGFVGKMRIGRPGMLHKEQDELLRILIFEHMEKSNMSYKQAGAFVARKNTYSPESLDRFQELLPFLNAKETEEFAKFVAKYIEQGLIKKRGKLKVKI